MDSSEIGRYGTVSFMKRLEPDKPVAAFPIDDDQVTFGRDPQCSVRLYYNSISPVHCKIIFQERKAFLVVLGTNGVTIDGCRVFPSASSPTTIALANNSEIEIHGKRFHFTYPPKALRDALFATPARSSPTSTPFRKRALRMSMIQSAQVFTPRPSSKAAENLRILQSPIKPFKTPAKESEPHHEGDDDQEVVLVEGDCPIIVQEEKDLVILEDVEVDDTDAINEQLKTPTQKTHGFPHAQNSPLRHFPAPHPLLQTPQRQVPSQTPRRRGFGSALHRAVLIRSAQRAVMKAEIEKEEAEEEREVEATVVVEGPLKSEESDCSSVSSEGEEETDDDKAAVTEEEEDAAMSIWRHRFEGIKLSSSSEPDVPVDHKDEEEEVDLTEVDIQDVSANDHDERIAQALESIQGRAKNSDKLAQAQEYQSVAQTPVLPRRFVNFSTPQVTRVSDRAPAGRFSLGGASVENGGVRRVLVEQAWRVKDIVVENTPAIKEEQEEPQRYADGLGSPEKRRPQLSDEERKAIRERRKSALTTPDNFFGGQAPGMRRMSAISTSPARTSRLSILPSPVKNEPGVVKNEEEETKFNVKVPETRDDDDGMDTRSLLEKMKETIEGMKRRRSLAPRPSLSPRKLNTRTEDIGFSLLAPGVKEELASTLQLASVGEGDVGEMAEDGDPLDGEGPAHDDVRTPRHSSQQVRPVNTPRMDDLRHVFGNPKVAATPSFKGVKHLFPQPQAELPGTPVFEGMGEMLSTPAPYRQSGSALEHDIHEDDEVDDEPRTAKRIGGRTRSTTPSIPKQMPEAQELTKGKRDRMKVDDDHHDDKEPDAEKSKPKARVPRGGKKAQKQAESLDKTDRPSPMERNSPSPQHEVNEERSSEDGSVDRNRNANVLALPPNTRSNPRRGRGRSPVPAEPNHGTPETDSAPTVTTKITRKRTPRSNVRSPEESEPQVPAVTETTHTVRVRSKAQSVDSDVPKAGSAKSQKATHTKPVEVDDDDDPLDSIGTPEPEVEEKPNEPSKPTRNTRRKATPKTEVSQSAGGKKTPEQAPKVGGRRTRASPADIASINDVDPDSGINKENTPNAGTEAVASEGTKVRVSRTRKAAAEKIKEEAIVGSTPSPDAVPVTKTRVTRARARK